MRTLIYNRGISHMLDPLKYLLAKLFSAREASENKALNLLQDSKGFDPVRNPQSLVAPKKDLAVIPDKRLPVRKAA